VEFGDREWDGLLGIVMNSPAEVECKEVFHAPPPSCPAIPSISPRDDPWNLDQVMTFKDLGGAPIQVNGWPKEPSVAAKDQWNRHHSDRGCLYLEVGGA
jgi:hypothetical protein